VNHQVHQYEDKPEPNEKHVGKDLTVQQAVLLFACIVRDKLPMNISCGETHEILAIARGGKVLYTSDELLKRLRDAGGQK
jgi:hypothetical protein